MRRRPNPWIVLPTLAAAAGGAVVGWFVTDASCVPDSCPALAGGVAAVAALLTGAGVAVVVVLAATSLREWRTHAERSVTTVRKGDESTEDTGPPTC